MAIVANEHGLIWCSTKRVQHMPLHGIAALLFRVADQRRQGLFSHSGLLSAAAD